MTANGRLDSMPGINGTDDNEAGQVLSIRYANGLETVKSYSAERDWLTQTRARKRKRKISNNATLLELTYTRGTRVLSRAI